MPGLDGYELFQRIRKIDRKIKVCFLSAAEVKEYKNKSTSDRRYSVKKPVPIKDLVDRINSILEEVPDTAT